MLTDTLSISGHGSWLLLIPEVRTQKSKNCPAPSLLTSDLGSPASIQAWPFRAVSVLRTMERRQQGRVHLFEAERRLFDISYSRLLPQPFQSEAIGILQYGMPKPARGLKFQHLAQTIPGSGGNKSQGDIRTRTRRFRSSSMDADRSSFPRPGMRHGWPHAPLRRRRGWRSGWSPRARQLDHARQELAAR